MRISVLFSFRFYNLSYKCNSVRDTSLELQQCGTRTSPTVADNQNSVGYPLQEDEPSQSAEEYSYVDDHVRDRFIAFLRMHLLSTRDQCFNCRHSQIAESSPRIPLSPLLSPQESNSDNEYLAPRGQTVLQQPGVSVSDGYTHSISHITSMQESECPYEIITDDEILDDDYDDVV